MTREYEKQIELAGANPERFVFQLHSFYNAISSKIRKGNLYAELTDFMGTYLELAHKQSADVNKDVVDAYVNLLMQTMEYIRPDKFEFKQSVIGVTTDGQPICAPQLYHDWDLPGYEIEAGIESGRISRDEALNEMTRAYEKYGYALNTIEDVMGHSEIQKLQDNTIVALMPFINEFTYDIFPKRNYNTWKSPLIRMDTSIDMEDLLSSLKARKKTLPINGVRITFQDPSDEVEELLLKEIVKNNIVFMLYRLSTNNGDVAGYFNTQTGFLYSINLECNEPGTYHRTKKFLLYCYALCVTNRFDDGRDKVFNVGMPVGLRLFGIGGKLRAVYDAVAPGITPRFRDTDDMESQTREINGYIRRLPSGQQASEAAVEMAKQMGYALESGETYVRPFSKEVFIKRSTAAENGA
jgi:hypothetical protein